MYGNQFGDMAWMDLSVPNAEQVKGFYQKVLGWQSDAVNMTYGDETYVDFAMSSAGCDKAKTSTSASDDCSHSHGFATGICHAKGNNADMPTMWLPYFIVKDIDAAVESVHFMGGSLVTKIKTIGDDHYVVIKDPAGAQCALYQKGVS